jgi:hypothetical protein
MNSMEPTSASAVSQIFNVPGVNRKKPGKTLTEDSVSDEK